MTHVKLLTATEGILKTYMRYEIKKKTSKYWIFKKYLIIENLNHNQDFHPLKNS